MTLDALRQSPAYLRPGAPLTGLLESVRCAGAWAKPLLRANALRSQPFLIGLGCAALFAAALGWGYLDLGPAFGLLCQAIAGSAFVIAAAGSRAAARKLETPARSYEFQTRAISCAGAVGLHWKLVSGELTWLGNAAVLFAGSDAPSNFRDLKSHLHPDESLYNSISDALKTQERRICWTIRLKDEDGGWRVFDLRGEIGTESGAPAFSGVLLPAETRDVQAQAAQSTTARLRAIIEALPMSFAVWDSQGNLQICNRKFRQLYRIAPGAALPGTPIDQLQALAKEPIAQRPTELSAAPGRFQLRDKQLPDGTWLQLYEYWTGEGTMVSVGTDITAPKLSERRLLDRERDMRAAMEVYEQSRRQLEIQTHQLRELAENYNEEKIHAEAANKAKSEFLANVSHELRTPLNAIIGFSEMIRDGVLGPLGNQKYEEYVSDINASGRYLLEMINDILDMSKIEAGRVTLEPEWVSLEPLVSECLRVVHPAAIERRVQLLKGGSSNISVLADKRALKQILINLLSNAVKFTLPGGKVSLRAYRYRGSVRIAIADTGVGIAKHEIARLGKPFEQVQNQMTKGHKGTGLGLAISRSLTELHGGKLDIKSKAGEGTTVTCILPAQEKKTLSREAA